MQFFEALQGGVTIFEARVLRCFETVNKQIKGGYKTLCESDLASKEYTLRDHDHFLNVLYLFFLSNKGPCQFLL